VCSAEHTKHVVEPVAARAKVSPASGLPGVHVGVAELADALD
jgi:hypothetical protein